MSISETFVGADPPPPSLKCNIENCNRIELKMIFNFHYQFTYFSIFSNLQNKKQNRTNQPTNTKLSLLLTRNRLIVHIDIV